MRHSLGAGLALLLLPALVAAAPPQAPMKVAIDRIVFRAEFSPALWGIEVRDAETGRVLYALNARKSFHPASTLKLVTTAAALDALGPDERIATTVETTAPLGDGGVLQGDLVLVGRGDPNLSGRFAEGRPTAALEELAEGVAAAGVRRVAGRVVGQEGLFRGGRRGEGWGWEDLVWWYGAEVSALSFNDNCAGLRVFPGAAVSDPVSVSLEPATAYFTVASTARTSPAGTKADLALTRDFGANLIRLSGSYPLGEAPAELNVALEDPARYAATVFAEVLSSRGIRVDGGAATASDPWPAGGRVLSRHESPPLSTMLPAVNKPSQNLHAEMLLRLVGARVRGEGTAEAGLDGVRAFLDRLGVDQAGWDLEDGSGLSSHDLVTPHGLCDFLVAMDRHPGAAVFRESLPVAGVDGSLRNRMKGTAAEGRLLAKTGSVRHSSALAGYARTRSGGRLVFAILLSHDTSAHHAATGAIDSIGALLAGR